jgi:hypothetical protein
MKPSKAILSPNNPLCKVGFARTRCLTLPDADNKKGRTLVHHFLRASLFFGSVFRFHFESAYTIIGIPFANKNFHFPQHLRMIPDVSVWSNANTYGPMRPLDTSCCPSFFVANHLMSRYGMTGREKKNSVPFPGSDLNHILPSCASMIFLTISRPSPVLLSPFETGLSDVFPKSPAKASNWQRCRPPP